MTEHVNRHYPVGWDQTWCVTYEEDGQPRRLTYLDEVEARRVHGQLRYNPRIGNLRLYQEQNP